MIDKHHHLLVAGTGRAGTSVLIRYLTGLGLETHISKHGEDSFDDAAQAGLEDLPLSSVTQDLPYVVKSPWSFQCIQAILDDPQIELDGVIVPVRDLISAAASRTVRQLHAIYQEAPWMAKIATTWEHWAMTPGGTVFSLNPVDQARLLAVGFHQLIEQLVRMDVPVLLLAFPRFVNDPDYLYRKLAPLLPKDISLEQAREIHAVTFKSTNVRTESELAHDLLGRTAVLKGFEYPAFVALDNAALKREGTRLRDRLSEAQREYAELSEQHDVLHSRMEPAEAQRAAAEAKCAALEFERDGLSNQLQQIAAAAEAKCAALEFERDGLRNQLQQMVAAAEAKCSALEFERDGLRNQLQQQLVKKALFEQQVLSFEASRSWRLTRPLRVIAHKLGVSRHHAVPGPSRQ